MIHAMTYGRRINNQDREQWREVMELHARTYDPDKRAKELRKAARDRARRLAWHAFWITTGTVAGTAITFISGALWLHLAVISTGIPAFAQEVTDFLKSL